ncbi:hypothetical protein [Marseilla massiliensis]|uniref:hypothetical protein n=1 Tax=Marseilla massiliensis TaxID=1841864 RepID=UPI002012CF98|nr:hypothetical protein [Marseilla massiliensis]MCL1611098.1 hypothetical protein [Marseilla massiliensis]
MAQTHSRAAKNAWRQVKNHDTPTAVPAAGFDLQQPAMHHLGAAAATATAAAAAVAVQRATAANEAGAHLP